VPVPIDLPKDSLADFCRRHRVRRLSLFGSALRDDFGPQSDVDFVVEFEPGTVVGYLKLAEMEMELSSLLGRKVDLRTPGELSRYFRDQVMATAEPLYVS
jgi:uncharacterized protein